MIKKLLFLFFSLFVCCLNNIKAEHLTGGNLTYEYLGGNSYKVRLNINRDGYNVNNTELDNSSVITIFNLDYSNYNIYTTETLPLISKQDISQSGVSNPCIINPPSVYIEKGYYEGNVSLPPNNRGYQIVYQRCCRNAGVINLYNSNDQGSTYDVFIPGGINRQNSSPYFNDFPPAFLCIGSKFYYDFSATDTDGDVLIYSLCAPQQGGSATNPAPAVASKPPYYAVDYKNNYDELHPLGMNASISINPNTGILYAVPSTQGLFTVGICVEEYRNGIFLNRVVQDIQLNVSDCVIPSAIPAVATGVGIPVYQSDDTTYKSCNGLKVNFANESVGNIKNYKWDFGDLTTLVDTSNLATPSYIYADTGRYEVTLIINPGEFCGDTSKMIVYVYKELAGNFTMNDACPKTAVQFTDYSNSFYNDLVSWKWKFGNGDSTFTQNPNYSYNNSGTYKVQLRAETALGCVVTAEKNITIYPTPKANFTNDFICYKSATQFNNTSTISSGTIDSYLWSFGDGTQSTATNPSHTFSAFQDATVELKTVSNFGCRDSIQKTIIIDDTLVLNTTSIQSNYCENELETIDNTTSGGNNLSYSWLHNGTEIATTQNITLPTNVFNQNRITLVAKNRCEEKTKSFNYFVQKAPNKTLAQNNIILCPGQTDTVFSFQALDSIFWNTNENNLNYIIIDGTIDPIIAKMYLKECSIEDTLQLNLDCDVAIPNAFSPNLDGVNDYFNLINSGSVETFKLQVFNRWGELLFETDSYNKPWDGTYKNQDVPVDSYVYIVKGIKKDTKNFFLKGIFNLFR